MVLFPFDSKSSLKMHCQYFRRSGCTRPVIQSICCRTSCSQYVLACNSVLEHESCHESTDRFGEDDFGVGVGVHELWAKRDGWKITHRLLSPYLGKQKWERIFACDDDRTDAVVFPTIDPTASSRTCRLHHTWLGTLQATWSSRVGIRSWPCAYDSMGQIQGLLHCYAII